MEEQGGGGGLNKGSSPELQWDSSLFPATDSTMLLIVSERLIMGSPSHSNSAYPPAPRFVFRLLHQCLPQSNGITSILINVGFPRRAAELFNYEEIASQHAEVNAAQKL